MQAEWKEAAPRKHTLVPVCVILADGYRFGGVSKAAVSFFILNRETQSHPCGQIARDAPA